MSDSTMVLSLGQDIFSTYNNFTKTEIMTYFAIIELGTDALQSELAELVGVTERKIRQAIAKFKAAKVLKVVKFGRQNEYFFAPKEDRLEEQKQEQNHDVSLKQTTTNNNIQIKKPKSPKRELTEMDYDNARYFGFQLEAPVTCAKGKPTLYDALRGFKGMCISDTLQSWREASEAGTLDTEYNGKPMTPNLMACKIIECQAPPDTPGPYPLEEESESHYDSVERDVGPVMVESDNWLASSSQEPDKPEWLTTLKDKLGVVDSIWNRHFADLSGFYRDDGYLVIEAKESSAAWLNGRFLGNIEKALGCEVEIRAHQVLTRCSKIRT